MKNPPIRRHTRLALLAALLSAGTALAGEPARSEGFSAGLTVQPRASAADIGLPLYPGATPERRAGDDSDGDSEGASISLWGGSFGMDLYALKLRSSDSVEAVSRFYRDAMSRQGRVLDCSRGAAPDTAPPAAADSKLARCENERGKPGGFLFKLALPGGVRMVAIEPTTGGSRIQLVRLMLRGE
jgi:hypothetical protein